MVGVGDEEGHLFLKLDVFILRWWSLSQAPGNEWCNIFTEFSIMVEPMSPAFRNRSGFLVELQIHLIR